MPGQVATTLTNVNISDTFYGVLHAGGQPIPATGQAQIYDGNGGVAALKLGVNCNGATICGGLSATSLSATSLSLTTPILSSILPNVTPSPAGTYTGYLTSINVTSKGIVTGVSTASTITLPYKAYAAVNFNGTYNSTANQGSSPANFTIADNSYNIAQILWVNTGLYRVTFTTPMTNTNYVPIVQNVSPALSGTLPSLIGTVDNVMCIGFKGLNFFEFVCYDDGAGAQNMIGCGILVI